MSNFRTLENIIRDVVGNKTAVDEQRFSLMGAIRRVGSKQPQKDAIAVAPVVEPDETVDLKQTDLPKNVLQKVLDPTTPEHHAHKEYVKRSQRKLKIID
jgi:hypothetical protein